MLDNSVPECFERGPMDQDRQISGLHQVMLEHRGRLLRFLAARGAGDDAEDVLQDLWGKLDAGVAQPIAEPIAYLFRAAENLMRDRHRSSGSRVRREQQWHQVDTSPLEHPVGERVLIAREQLRQAEGALAALGPRVDRTFRLFRLEGRTQAEIGRDLGVSLSTVEKDLQKAYRALAELKQDFDAG